MLRCGLVFHGVLDGPHRQGTHVPQTPVVARLLPGFRCGKEIAKTLPSYKNKNKKKTINYDMMI
jgi:hypothetical protein